MKNRRKRMNKRQAETLAELVRSETLENDQKPIHKGVKFLEDRIAYYEGILPRTEDGKMMDNEEFETLCTEGVEDHYGRSPGVVHWRNMKVYTEAKKLLDELA